LATLAAIASSIGTARADVVYLDDGEKIARDAGHPLPPSVWPKAIELSALAGETVAFQAVLDVGPKHRATASLAAFEAPLVATVQTFGERFVPIARRSGNDREPGSLAFTPRAAPPATGPASFIGSFADPLEPGAPAYADEGQRAAIWIDVSVPLDAVAGTYHSTISVKDGDAVVDQRPLVLRVLGQRLAYDNRAITVYYDRATLRKRLGDQVDSAAHVELRQLLHAHHVSAIHEVLSPDAMSLDDEALDGTLYTKALGYDGPGSGVGERVFAIGAYGALGEPSEEKAELVGRFAKKLRDKNLLETTLTFVYAVDEDCASPRARAWRDRLAFVPDAQGVRVGATCGNDPMEQAADLVMMTADRYDPEAARTARAKGKSVWAYNGQRPYAGPMMLDVPAIDLRANAWIAARYDVEHWFYWESTFWLDSNRGGKGGANGHDPFVVAETFHNKSGDYANGDGILVYPGRQAPAGMTSLGTDATSPLVVPSVRLKNLRRGAQDLGWLALARAHNPDATDEVVRSMIPRALHDMKDEPVTWPERGAKWLEARARLQAILEGPARAAAPKAPEAPGLSEGRSLRGCAGTGTLAALVALALLTILRSVLKSRRDRPS
jgi:hypothetical protein